MNADAKHDVLHDLCYASSSDVRPFIENIHAVNRLHNEPTLVLADEDNLYVLPVRKSETDSVRTDEMSDAVAV